MKSIIKISLLFLVLIVYSCTINIKFQTIAEDYNKAKKEGVVKFIHLSDSPTLCSAKTDTATVLVATGTQLKSCLKNYEKALVYIWSVECSSPTCYPISTVREKCEQKGLELFVVADFYNSKYMCRDYGLKHPIIGIDVEYYKTNFKEKHLSELFISDLLMPAKRNEVYRKKSFNGLIYFTNGNFNEAFDYIEEL